jgi:hypothetical protein
MTTDELCAALKELGIRVTVDDGTPHLRGVNIPDVLVKVAKFHREELIRRFGPRPKPQGGCPSCHGPTDARGACWKCCNRICCDCGGPTGSAFIATCIPCQYRTAA